MKGLDGFGHKIVQMIRGDTMEEPRLKGFSVKPPDGEVYIVRRGVRFEGYDKVAAISWLEGSYK